MPIINSMTILEAKWYTFWWQCSDNRQKSIKKITFMLSNLRLEWLKHTTKKSGCLWIQNSGKSQKLRKPSNKPFPEFVICLAYFVRLLRMPQQNGSMNFLTIKILISCLTTLRTPLTFLLLECGFWQNLLYRKITINNSTKLLERLSKWCTTCLSFSW